MRLEGQTAFVTGAGRGIGLAVARALASEGCNVALVARTAYQVEEAAALINESRGGRAVALPADVRDASAMSRCADAAAGELGPISLLVNNAGTAGPAGTEWEVDGDAWWECIESILRGAFNCTQAILPGMLGRSAGRVIDMASISGTTAFPLMTATSIAKTALIRRAEGLAVACAATGVTAFALHPGVVRTELLESYTSHPDMAAWFASMPAEFFSPPELAAGVVARIAAGDFDQLSGSFLDATADLDAMLDAHQGSADANRLRIATG